ncbi:hypothetical protein D1164_01450 [Mariniphaga sediminis]|uniref:Calcineurin-like phosphoesterase domain-containing protein n=1 Tax=Mariniphaga sediminis TaxID=1628158 RepID=A0A399D737_9BACT|nr:metallophosphoesterase [Mariniphaga sediminis]RIH67123.1 hypothetical protein D1164_01450 [Mariniphaga sediminis]
MKSYNRIFLLIIITLFYTFQVACAQIQQKTPDKKDSFSFVFMTDVHIQPERHAVEGVLQAIDTINKIEPDFVLTGGDNVMDASSQSLGRADSLYSLFTNTMKVLKMPWYSTFGNHETFGLHKKDFTSEQRKGMYKKYFEKTYYTFEHKGWQFIVLDAIMYGDGREDRYYGQIDSVQMDWMKSVFDTIGTEKPVIVSLHIPILSVGDQIEKNGFTPRSVIRRGNAMELIRLFEAHNVKAVLQGHLHMYEDISFNGIHYITAGAVCGGWWEARLPGKEREEGFLLVNINGDEFTSEYIDYGWDVEE